MSVDQVAAPGVRSGTVGAYLTSSDIARVRAVRARVGAVTLAGKPGLRAARALAKAGDLSGIDLDPAQYLANPKEPEGLFDIDWEAEQADLGLPTVRSAGIAVPAHGEAMLRKGLSVPIRPGSRRLVSLHSWWLRDQQFQTLLAGVRNCDDPLSLVFADLFDPLRDAGTIDAMCQLLDTAAAPQRPVELLRCDVQAIPFVFSGGTLGTIGLTSSARHHGLPFPSKTRKEYEERQRSPWVWVEGLLGWQQGIKLGALAPFNDLLGLTRCPCTPCDGEPLTRFAREWSSNVPNEVRQQAQDHDVARWMSLVARLRNDRDPLAAWRRECAAAVAMESNLVATFKISALTVPGSITQWATQQHL